MISHGKYDSLLIYDLGKLLIESYFRRGRIKMPHGEASATKTYTGLVLGRALTAISTHLLRAKEGNLNYLKTKSKLIYALIFLDIRIACSLIFLSLASVYL